MAMPESTPRRPVKPGQNRDSRNGVFGHPESQVGPLPRVGLYARVSTPHQHMIGMQLREFLERVASFGRVQAELTVHLPPGDPLWGADREGAVTSHR